MYVREVTSHCQYLENWLMLPYLYICILFLECKLHRYNMCPKVNGILKHWSHTHLIEYTSKSFILRKLNYEGYCAKFFFFLKLGKSFTKTCF